LERVAMTPDTIFDLASLTKPLATAASILLLEEQDKLKVSDSAAKHWPEFGQHGKEKITLEHLLLHTSGLIADNPVADYAGGKENALACIADLTPLAAPGERFVYSDVGYMVLGEIVERAGGLPLDQFARRHLYEPLGLKETGFKPAEELRTRCAPTEKR